MLAGNITISLDPGTILVWALIGLVAGYLASRIMLGHGMGIIADVIVGIIGAISGGIIANYFGVTITVPGHPIISQIIIAFIGAVVLLAILRILGMGRPRRARFARY